MQNSLFRSLGTNRYWRRNDPAHSDKPTPFRAAPVFPPPLRLSTVRQNTGGTAIRTLRAESALVIIYRHFQAEVILAEVIQALDRMGLGLRFG